MKKILMDDFIRRYEFLYYDPTSCPDGYKWRNFHGKDGLEEFRNSCLKNYLDISNLSRTDYNAEERIMELLTTSTFNETALAWKAGRVIWQNNQLKTNNFDKGDYYINGLGGHIDKYDFQEYCKEIESKKDQINRFVDEGNWEKAYKAVAENSPKNMGPVYNINTLFFITGGKAPIYDAFAHKAVKALLFGIPPKEVYLGNNPGKKEIDKTVAMYKEYLLLLRMVFKEYFNGKKKTDVYIPRELDRALWVYGHAEKTFEF